MLLNNPLQFAITREDPEIELDLIRSFGLKNVLAVCSGGDTLLAIKEAFPKVGVTGFDFNPVQLSHFVKKINKQGDDLTTSGNFDSLFRQWRRFFNEFVLNEECTNYLFESGDHKIIEKIIESKYWPVSFDLHFHDAFLLAMFGAPAIQHAPKGSYPRYFQKAFEKGLNSKEFNSNPFLQHLFLGDFSKTPSYLTSKSSESDFSLVQGSLNDVKNLSSFDLVQLSNIFDWSSLDEIKATCLHLNQELKAGAVVLIRQINNESPIAEYLGPAFEIHEKLGTEYQKQDRSLFYSKIIVAQKRGLK